MPGEFDFIQWIRKQSKMPPNVRIGPGDDLAAMEWNADDLLVVGADQVLDGVHFDSNVHSPRDIGRKAMNRNLSDCAAMACLPAAAVVTAALPRGASLEYAKEIYLGLREAADVFDFPIVGGDTGTWDGKLALSVTILGRSAGVEPITRSGAKVGDAIYVTGALGGSIRGRHMTFEPRVLLARELAKSCKVSAMIDISDGLSRDLRHICEQSHVGAIVDANAVPIHSNAGDLQHALHDGEDYELLFTSAHCEHPEVIRIGEIVSGEGVQLRQDGALTELKPQGWEHSF